MFNRMSWLDEGRPCLPILVFPKCVTIRDRLRNTDEWYAYECNVCKRTYNEREWAYNNIYNHLRTKEHRERMEQHASNYCGTCGVQCASELKLRAHLETKRHKQKESGMIPETTHCDACDMKFIFASDYRRHIATKAHARKLLPPPQRSCDVCGIKVTTDKQMEAHFATKKHQRLSQTENLLVPAVSSGV